MHRFALFGFLFAFLARAIASQSANQIVFASDFAKDGIILPPIRDFGKVGQILVNTNILHGLLKLK
jgi:hypothetical protein